MDRINDKEIIKKFKRVHRISSERASLIGQFVEELNKNRSGFKPVLPVQVAVRFSKLKIKTKDLYILLSKCKQSVGFDKYFWWATRPENITSAIYGIDRLL